MVLKPRDGNGIDPRRKWNSVESNSKHMLSPPNNVLIYTKISNSYQLDGKNCYSGKVLKFSTIASFVMVEHFKTGYVNVYFTLTTGNIIQTDVLDLLETCTTNAYS